MGIVFKATKCSYSSVCLSLHSGRENGRPRIRLRPAVSVWEHSHEQHRTMYTITSKTCILCTLIA
jgi:hypothetical protein